MTNNFKQVMEQKSDSQLLEIVTKLKADYQPEAVVAAQNEIEKRNLTGEQIEQAEFELEVQTQKTFEHENEPLGIFPKILFFIFFWGIIPWGIAATYKADGYARKYKDAWKSMKTGIVVFVGIPMLILIISQVLTTS